MIEVTIWFGNVNGDGAQPYLVNTPHSELFDIAPQKYAVGRALEEFLKSQPQASIRRIDIHVAPSRVIT